MQHEHDQAGPETLLTVAEVGASYIRLSSKLQSKCIIGSDVTGNILPAQQPRKDETSQFVIKVTVCIEKLQLQLPQYTHKRMYSVT